MPEEAVVSTVGELHIFQNYSHLHKLRVLQKKAIIIISKINGDDRNPISSPNITPDAIANQLLLNGKPDQNGKIRNKKAVLKTDSRETILSPFAIRDIGYAISLLKDSKAPGLDNSHHEMIKCFVPTIWLCDLDMLNECLKQQHIPNVWWKAKVIARLKPGKDPESPKGYRPIAQSPSVQDRAQANPTNRQVSDRGNRAAHKCSTSPSTLGTVLNLARSPVLRSLTSEHPMTPSATGGSLVNSLC